MGLIGPLFQKGTFFFTLHLYFEHEQIIKRTLAKGKGA